MNCLDRSYGTRFASPDVASARRDLRISTARFTATLRKLERMIRLPYIDNLAKSSESI